MEWSRLHTNKRLKDGLTTGSGDHRDARNSFQRDYDRIIFSAPFRRLQDKTQVFPLLGPVFVHNRLTHSLEVASVGRSLGQLVGNHLVEVNADFDLDSIHFYKQDLAHVIAAACLAHDMGNPPFGHSGEDAIRAYFDAPSPAVETVLKSQLSDAQWRDLRHFEGNSMAFRMVSQQGNNVHAALNLTMTTIASLIKYPCNSVEGFDKTKRNISLKKAGYFLQDEVAFQQVMQFFELPKISGLHSAYARHPFVYLTEAADDICYRIIDVEDAHRLGIVEESKVLELFMPFFENGEGRYQTEVVLQVFHKIPNAEERIAYLRATWIGWMVEQTYKLYIEQEAALLAGSLQGSLLDLLPYQKAFEAINTYSVEKIYQYPNSMEIEIGGYKVLGSIIDELLTALFYPDRSKSKKIIQLLKWESFSNTAALSVYDQCMLVLDFVSSMTDNYAIDLYRKLLGVKMHGF